MSSAEQSSSSQKAGDIFATTHWTVVLAAGCRQTPQSAEALEELCKTYWFPLYAYIRRRGHTKEQAEDLTQEFFARFINGNYLNGLSAERGRFRAFLLASVKHFLANEWDKANAQKRGGRAVHLSLDWQTADTQFQVAARTVTPDEHFDREWAIALLAKVMRRLEGEFAQEGRGEEFETLKVFLTLGKSAVPYKDVAATLKIDEGAARVAVHRLRKQYRKLLLTEISQTLSEPAQAAEELQSLFSAFSSR